MRLAERAVQQIRHAEDQPVGIDRARIERLQPRKRQQPLGQLRRPLGADQRVVERAFGARLDHAAFGDADIADDDGQQVVEVVRDAAGQLADRLHLLRLPQRLLGAFAPLAFVVELARTPHGQEYQRQQNDRGGDAEVKMRRHRAQPVGDDRVGLHAVGHVEIRVTELAEGDAALRAVDRIVGGDGAAVGHARDVEREPAVGRKFRQVMRRGGMARENGAVGARQREADLVPVARQLRVELGKHLRRHRHHDDAGEFAVARRPAPADAEERALPHARLQDGADVSAGVARLLRQEIVAVGDADGRSDRSPRRPACCRLCRRPGWRRPRAMPVRACSVSDAALAGRP